jgi:integrase/recombinase XerD
MSTLTLINQNPLTTAKTDSQVLEMWLTQKSISTQKQYKSVVKQFFNFLEFKAIATIVYDDLIAWLSTINNLSHNTQRGKIAIIKSLFSFCEKLGYCQFNVAKILKQPKEQDTLQERILRQDDVKELINNTDNLRDKLITKTIYILGLRVSEVVSLKWSDIFFQDDKIIIKILGKGDKIRYLILPENLFNELLTIRLTDNDLIFVSRKKASKLTTTQVYRIIRSNGETTLNKHVSPHYLRHSHATHSLKNGCDLKLLSNNLGHGNISITSRYLHCNQDDCSSNYLSI